MEFLKKLFENNEALTFEQLEEKIKVAGLKIADLASGEYVAKKKYTDDIAAKDTQITTLNDTLTTRAKELDDVKEQLKTAGSDKTKLETVSKSLEDLQTKYDNDTKNYQAQLAAQAYEFAVRDFASTKKFTSNAAKRDFTSSMIAKKLNFENGKIMGAEDFVTAYAADNEDAFVKDESETQIAQQNNNSAAQPPTFVQTTTGTTAAKEDNPFAKAFNFVGVRKKE